MKIVALSDTHGKHRDLKPEDVPEGDVLIHAGDMTKHGKLNEVYDFAEWFSQFEHEYKIAVAGNHDFCFDGSKKRAAIEKLQERNIIYLEDEQVVIDGKVIYGSPYSNTFDQYVFNDGIGSVPKNTDILITHGPPKGVLDKLDEYGHIGAEDLKYEINDIDFQAHIFGHVHEQFGRKGNSYNVSVLGGHDNYQMEHSPVVIEIE